MNKSTNIFGQILQLVDRNVFQALVKKTGAEKNTKGFSSWDHFTSMLFCQIGNAHSLREITFGLASMSGKLNHLGMDKAPGRTTLSYANNHRPWELFQELFYVLLDRFKVHFAGKNQKFKFKHKLYSLDASIIELSVGLFNWAKYRRTKGAIKLHLILDHEGYLPTFAAITEGKIHEVNVARTLEFPKGSIVAVDRGYYDYSLFDYWSEKDVSFVTRTKKNIKLDSMESLPINEIGVLRDEKVIFSNNDSFNKCTRMLRRVKILDAEKDKVYTFLTNNFELSAATIAAVYKDRWQIESFFKTIKQNLRIKSFVGTSKNAVLIQIWTALIALLLLKFLENKAETKWSLSNLIAVLRINLISYIDLLKLLNQEYKDFLSSSKPEQLMLWQT
jgi:hypothetical protein